jgi:capsular exopolysaccharide synthesis family protein
LGERHPEIIRLQDAVENAERKLQTEISKLTASIRNEYEAARGRERATAAALDRQKEEVSDLNAKSVEYTALEGEARANRLLMDNLVQRSRQIALARDLPSGNATILDAAQVPGGPILPRTTRNTTLSLAGSGALSLALIFLLEVFDTRMTSVRDLRRYLRIPLLGVVPQAKPLDGTVSLLLGDGAPPQFAELLQGVRTNLLASPHLATAPTLLVTSSEPGEGKTLTSANLAMSLARLKQRVLLIDADMRQPRLHDLFGQELQPGLTDVMRGTLPSSALRKTKVAGLWLLPAGSTSHNPADLLGADAFGKFIDMLRTQFDWVLIDSPPVLAVTDACLIARVTSGVLLVVGRGQTPRAVACAAVDRLVAAGGNVVGAMLNRAVLSRRGESYLPYYHRDYQTYYPQHDDSPWLPETLDVPPNVDSSHTSG